MESTRHVIRDIHKRYIEHELEQKSDRIIAFFVSAEHWTPLKSPPTSDRSFKGKSRIIFTA